MIAADTPHAGPGGEEVPPRPPAAGPRVPTRRPDVAAFALDDELVLYDPCSARAHVLNATAARMWELCDGARTTSSVAREIAASYALDDEQAHADVREFVEDLGQAGLLRAD
jgi:pyrroloquinoline quinone biosynthesis protein D